MIASAANDDMDAARRRMRHLEPWRVTPVPPVHAAGRKYATPSLSQEAKDRYKVLAMNVLALHIATAPQGREPSRVAGLD